MIQTNAYAKINLSLEIIGKREDGYHIIDSVIQTISLHDRVRISVADEGIIEVKCSDDSLSGELNICAVAARLFFDCTKINGGCYIYIEKNIPVSAGLGGGSSDACEVLKSLNSIYGNPLNLSELKTIALSLGADVPFFINGGTARVKGIGEDIKTFESKLPLWFVLIKTTDKPSTAHMYKKFDNLEVFVSNKNISYNCEKSLSTADFNLFIESFYNDFSAVWNYDKIKNDLIDNGALAVSLSGSGPTVMGVFESKNNADKAYNTLKSKYKHIYSVESV